MQTKTSGTTGTWSAFFRSYFFICFFSIFFVVVTALGGLTSLSTIKYVLVYSLIWMLVPLWLPKMTRPWLWSVGAVCWASSLLKLGYFAIYRQEMSQGVFFTLFESNPEEGSEFFTNYFHWWMLPSLLAYTAAAVALGRGVRPFALGRKARMTVTAIVALAFIEPAITYWNGPNSATFEKTIRKLADRHAGIEPWQTAISYYRYRNELQEVQGLLQAMTTQRGAPIQQQDKHPQQTYVLVIGESTNRQRMSLYGYDRDTTPKLDAMRDQLIAFDNVIAARPYTIESLRQALTFGNGVDTELELSKPNVVSLMKRAGFKTFWITNQQTISSRNTMLTAYSQMADEKVYLNNNRVQSSSHYDDVVLEPFTRAMADTTDKKFIVVHLLGTHIGYQHRYPESFTRFTQHNAGSSLNESQQNLFNQYDNAVAYNDVVMSGLIERYQRSSPYGVMLYFSDHGEEVFDFREFQGRNENDPTSHMYTVPFIIAPGARWAEQNAARVTQMQQAIHAPFSLAHFIHAWCDLVTINWQDCQTQHSLFNSAFTATPRLIGDPARLKSLRDYDTAVASIGARKPNLFIADASRRKPPQRTPDIFSAAMAKEPVH
jgi:heptose-I-phosphate ethanolaminephosphotransferase